MVLAYIRTAFENASPANWEISDENVVRIHLLYDHERAAFNRAAGHWHLLLEGDPGTELTIFFENFDNIWNGKHGSPISARTPCFFSTDGVRWDCVPCTGFVDNTLEFHLRLPAERVFIARLEPYTASHLDRLLQSVAAHPLGEVRVIGQSAEGRNLSAIHLGRSDARLRVLLRARSHPWEPGGNWVLEGLIRKALEPIDGEPHLLDACYIYSLPMANPDGVARGYTRFNVAGKDLNREWDHPADPQLAPESRVLEEWIEQILREDGPIHLGIDLHNDQGGRLHFAHPDGDPESYLSHMQRFEALLREHTWFTEGHAHSNFRNSGTFSEGLTVRYGIDAFTFELNCEWIAGLGKVPFAQDWQQLGEQMHRALLDYGQQT